MPAPIGHRDKVIAAALTGAVVVVVGYASGIGLRTDASAATTPPPPTQAAPPAAPAGELPSAVPPPAAPEGYLPAQVPPAAPPGNQPPPGTPPTIPPHLPPGTDPHPPGHDPSDPPSEPPSEPGDECEDGAVRALVDMLLPADTLPLTGLNGPLSTDSVQNGPFSPAADDEQGVLGDTLDTLIGYCDPAEPEPEEPGEDDPHDDPAGHGGG